MGLRERLQGILKPEDDEVDRDRLEAMAKELGAAAEEVARILATMGYKWNRTFGMWIKRSRGSRLQHILASIKGR